MNVNLATVDLEDVLIWKEISLAVAQKVIYKEKENNNVVNVNKLDSDLEISSNHVKISMNVKLTSRVDMELVLIPRAALPVDAQKGICKEMENNNVVNVNQDSNLETNSNHVRI